LYYFHKKNFNLKKNKKTPKKHFKWVVLGGFFGWVFYWQPCLDAEQGLGGLGQAPRLTRPRFHHVSQAFALA
jgi:hypothetical protein